MRHARKAEMIETAACADRACGCRTITILLKNGKGRDLAHITLSTDSARGLIEGIKRAIDISEANARVPALLNS